MAFSFKSFFDPKTSTLSYIVYDEQSRDAVIIDPVLDFQYESGEISFTSLHTYLSFLKSNELKLHYILETHVHADHLTCAPWLKEKFPEAKIGIGQRITEVQKSFQKIYHLPEFKADGSQFDVLFKDGTTIEAGKISIKILSTPGHTPACCTFLIEDHLFTGDALFMPDFGVGRCDFPGGSAKELYESITQKVYSYPESYRVSPGHDYRPGGRELKFISTVKEQKESNIHIKSSTKENDFVNFRTERDKTLSAPKLLLPSLQVNMNGGRWPIPHENELYLKIPLTLKK